MLFEDWTGYIEVALNWQNRRQGFAPAIVVEILLNHFVAEEIEAESAPGRPNNIFAHFWWNFY